MEPSASWEVNRFLDSQEIPRILCNPKVHYRFRKCPPTVHILRQLVPDRSPLSYFLKIYINIILPSTPGSTKWFLSLRYPTQNFCIVSPTTPIRATHSTHLILLYFITPTILGGKYGSLSSSLCSFLHSSVTSSLLGPNIFLNTLFPNTIGLCSSLSVSDQVSHPDKKHAKL